ncbi:hypothetical protein [Salsipaludibacter albus]|uniref:hypothetical protein n=1 Tax=Salsipaludibacter albus TaxID=2849650 RepID=UPI001EE4BB3D|nr:hypothetical protein [Salsipaludibacter albus]MBY5161232.1 hypothetical protein [Salsipaludibacter albus]
MITGEELAAYAAGEADPALVARVESALPGDPELAARLARLQRLDDLLVGVPVVTMTDEEAARLASAVDADLAALADERAAAATAGAGAAAGVGAAASAGGDDPGEVVDLASRRSARTTATGAGQAWFDPMRLVGVAAALLVVVGVAAVALNGVGGGDDMAGSADMAAAPREASEADTATEEMMELPTGTEEAMAATEAATEAGGDETAAAAAGDPMMAAIPVIDDQRVVPDVSDIDPTALRQRLEPLVDLGAIDEPEEDSADGETATDTSDAVGIADGQVTDVDVETVADCLPTDLPVIVAEVIVLAPARAAIAYVLADRVLVVDAVTCGVVAELPDPTE